MTEHVVSALCASPDPAVESWPCPIPTSLQRPPEGKAVLIWAEGDWLRGIFDRPNDRYWTDRRYHVPGPMVTHWLPLPPDPPEEVCR